MHMQKKQSKLILLGSSFLFLFNFALFYFSVGAAVQFIMGRGDLVTPDGFLHITLLKFTTTLLSGFFAGIVYHIFIRKTKIWKKILLLLLCIVAAFVVSLFIVGMIYHFALTGFTIVRVKVPYFVGLLVFSTIAKILYDKFLLHRFERF